MTEVRISPRARREIEDAFDWLRERSLNAAADFIAEVEVTLNLIAEAPERFPVVRGQLRRTLLSKFPYAIYYKVFPTNITVVGAIHGRRHPRSWLGRA